MKKALSFIIIILLTIPFIFSQGQTHYKKTSGTVNISGGYYTYSTEIKYRIKSAGYNNKPTVLQVGFRHSKITSITYNDQNGADLLTNVSFPVDTRFQASIKGVLILKNNSGPNQVDVNFSEPAVSDGALDDFYFSTSVINNIKQTFGEDVTYNDLTPILSKVNLDNFAVDYHDLTNKMDAVIRQINNDKLLAEKAEKERQKTEEQENTSESYDYSQNSSSNTSSPQNNSNTSNIPLESIYQKKQREAKEEKDLEQERIDKQLEIVRRQEQINKETIASIDKLSQELDQQLKNTFNSWAKQSEFNKTMSSLTRIENTSINSIIAEVKQKSRAIDKQYAQRNIDRRNEIAYQGEQYAKKATTQSEADLSNSITSFAQTLSQSSIEKQRREAQQELRQQQKNAEEELEERFIEKILPNFKQYFELALKSVFANEEKYYLEHVNYNECLIDNSYAILTGYNNCPKPVLKKPTGNPTPSGVDFYNAYLRKKNSSNEYLNKAAVYQLELAIDANPNNANWLYESVLIKEMNIYEKTAILKKAHTLDSNNSEIKNAYELTLNELKTLKREEKAYFIKHNNRFSNFEWELHNGLKGITLEDHVFFVNQRGEEIFKIDNFDIPSYKTLNRLSSRDIFYKDEEIQFGNGLARFGKVQDKKLLYGYINTKGEIIIPAQFSDAAQFSEGLAPVQEIETELWGYINERGQLIIPFQFSEASHFSEGLAAISHPSYPYGAYLNKKGKIAIEGKKNFIITEPFINGSSMVQTGTANSFTLATHEDHYKYILPSGKFLNNKRFVKTFPFSKTGYAIVGTANRYYIIDKSGKQQHKKTFKDPPVFINGKAKVDNGTLLSGYYNYITIDETGKTIKD